MAIEIYEDIHVLDHAYRIRNQNGLGLIHSDSILENKSLYNVKKGERYIIDWHFKASLTNFHGNFYTIASALIIPVNYEEVLLEFCDRVLIAVQFKMLQRQKFPLIGLIHWENEVDIFKM